MKIHAVFLLFTIFAQNNLIFGQIDYPGGFEKISTNHPHTKVTWILDASREVPLYFSKNVTFVSTKTENLATSRIKAIIRHNGHDFKSFEFKVGDGLVNHLETSKPIKLNRGDSVTIHFYLIPETENEDYIFSIYDTKSVSSSVSSPIVKSTSVTTPKQVVVASNKPKEFKMTPDKELKRLRRNRTIEGILGAILR